MARGAARLLLDECKKRPFHGSLLQLGRQNIFFTMKDLRKWADYHHVSLADIQKIQKSEQAELAELDFIDDKTFFTALGFEKVHSCDASDYEGATFISDLNEPVAAHMHDRYDVIIDGGTAEHIFHFPNVLKNIHNMLKVGGRVIHFSPSSNHVDHGFYMFSPTLFHDYYTANNYRIETLYIIEYTIDHEIDPWRIYNYVPGSLAHLSYGGFGKGLLGIHCVASKTEDSTDTVVPQQHVFIKEWQKPTERDEKHFIERKTRYAKVKLVLKRVPPLYRIVRKAKRKLRSSGKLPPMVAKY